MIESVTAFAQAEAVIIDAVRWLRLVVETIGAAVIALGIVIAAAEFVRAAVTRRREGYVGVRLTLARYLVVALEFQLAADILSTAISPTWEQIGQLAAIAIIRTGLNYFLHREMAAEAAEVARSRG